MLTILIAIDGMTVASRSPGQQADSQDNNPVRGVNRRYRTQSPNGHGELAEELTGTSNNGIPAGTHQTATSSQNWLIIARFLQEQFSNDNLEEFVC